MNIDVKFEELSQEFKADFGEVVTASDSGYERGYEAGYEDGRASVPDLLSMRVGGTLAEYASESVTTVGAYGFYGLSKLEKVDLPNATSVAGNGFMNCTALRSVNLPKVKSLANYAFQGCQSITELDLPSLQSMQGAVFSNNKSLTALILRNANVCTLGNANVFGGTPIASGTGFVYVPDNLVDSYKAARNWSTYAAQIKPLSEYNE